LLSKNPPNERKIRILWHPSPDTIMKTLLEEISEKAGLDTLFQNELPKLERPAARLPDHVPGHPLPYPLLGTGLALIAVRALSHRQPPEEAAAQEFAESAKNGATRLREHFVEPVAHAVESARDRARDAVENLADRAAKVTDKAAEGTRRAGRNISDFVEKNPWAVGAGIVAIRFVAGLVSRHQPTSREKFAHLGSDLKKDLRDFLRAILDERA